LRILYGYLAVLLLLNFHCVALFIIVNFIEQVDLSLLDNIISAQVTLWEPGWSATAFPCPTASFRRGSSWRWS